MAVVILVPPEAPTTKRGTHSLSRNMVGVIEDMGRLKGSIKLLSEGSTPKAFFVPGVEKSSISLLYIIPVRVERYFEPKLKVDKNVNLLRARRFLFKGERKGITQFLKSRFYEST